MSNINFEEISFGMIQKIGEAKFKLVEAFNHAKDDKFQEARKFVEEAEIELNEAAKLHMDVIVAEANGEQIKFNVLFMHAEDQFLTTQTFALTVRMLIEVLEKNKK